MKFSIFWLGVWLKMFSMSVDVTFDHTKYILLVHVWQREADYSLYILDDLCVHQIPQMEVTEYDILVNNTKFHKNHFTACFLSCVADQHRGMRKQLQNLAMLCCCPV